VIGYLFEERKGLCRDSTVMYCVHQATSRE